MTNVERPKRIGRPPIGNDADAGHLRLPPALLRQIDEQATRGGISRMEVIRRVLDQAIRGQPNSVQLSAHQMRCLLSLINDADLSEEDPRRIALRQVRDKVIRSLAIGARRANATTGEST
jgi:metal-responsive CopG/Arc/MetJ family transcriptional regulator